MNDSLNLCFEFYKWTPKQLESNQAKQCFQYCQIKQNNFANTASIIGINP